MICLAIILFNNIHSVIHSTDTDTFKPWPDLMFPSVPGPPTAACAQSHINIWRQFLMYSYLKMMFGVDLDRYTS